MRLLHTTSLLFEEFFDNNIPPYAILSHRWEGKEVGLHEFEAAKERDGPEFSKIKNFCSFVSRQPDPNGDLEWVWIDTCCIDKKNSTELSEAINSMFQWYKRALVCYAYLSNVDAGDRKAQEQQFRNSPWFTRGWTLQELIAPGQVYFLNRQWNIIGEKNELAAEISAITGIEQAFLTIPKWTKLYFRQASIATKMSWASKRMTTRLEDMAYCLLGIFDINMPFLYGEGMKAFMRLQLEIIKKSDDESIFAWTNPDNITVPHYMNHGMLAPWPTWFANCGDIMTGLESSRPPYSMTNKGLEFHIPPYTSPKDYTKVALNCFKRVNGEVFTVTVGLHSLKDNSGHRSTDATGFEDHTKLEGQGSNTHLIYIPQIGL